jgi:type IV fimbrial biogenesis protein FimT
LTSVAVPSWQRLVEKNTLANARSQMIGILRLGRSSAVAKSRYVTLCATLDGETCSDDYLAWHKGYMLFLDDDGDRERTSDERILRTIAAAESGITIHSSTGRRTVRFASDGSAWGSNLTMRFCNEDADIKNLALMLIGTGRTRQADSLWDGSPVICDG